MRAPAKTFFDLKDKLKCEVLERAPMTSRLCLALASWKHSSILDVMNIKVHRWEVKLTQTEKSINLDFEDGRGSIKFYFVDKSEEFLKEQGVPEDKIKECLMGNHRIPKSKKPLKMKNLFVHENIMGCELKPTNPLDPIFEAVLRFFQDTLNWQNKENYRFCLDEPTYKISKRFFDNPRKASELCCQGNWLSEPRIERLRRSFKIHTLIYDETCVMSGDIFRFDIHINVTQFEVVNTVQCFEKNYEYPYELAVRNVYLDKGSMQYVRKYVYGWARGLHDKLEFLRVQVPEVVPLPRPIMDRQKILEPGERREENYHGDWLDILQRMDGIVDFEQDNGRRAAYGYIQLDDHAECYLLCWSPEGLFRDDNDYAYVSEETDIEMLMENFVPPENPIIYNTTARHHDYFFTDDDRSSSEDESDYDYRENVENHEPL